MELDRLWGRLYRELVAERPDMETLFNEPPDLSKFPEKDGVMVSPLSFWTLEEVLRVMDQGDWNEDQEIWDAKYPEEAKEMEIRFWKSLEE